MSRKYKNPPIVEAVADFQFIPNQPWDMTIPGLLYERIRDQFPLKKQRTGLKIGIQPEEGDRSANIIETSQRMQFFRKDEKALIQLGPNRLSVNSLKPYPGWESFKPLILSTLKNYQEIANPQGFRKIGLRYINKIAFTEEAFELKQYFDFFPAIPEKIPRAYEGFKIKVGIPYGGRDRLVLTMASIAPDEIGKISVLLDLDFGLVDPGAVSIVSAFDWVEEAHNRIEEAFEACITDKCRGLLGEEK